MISVGSEQHEAAGTIRRRGELASMHTPRIDHRQATPLTQPDEVQHAARQQRSIENSAFTEPNPVRFSCNLVDVGR